ncbi:MAG: hypothetical protein AAFQ68_01710 [Bacteroidota bacterium]
MRSILLILYTVTLLAACTPPEIHQTLSGSWDLQYYENLETGEQYAKPEHVPKPVKITFTDKGRNGKFEGETVVNPFYGKYRLFEDGTMIVNEFAGNLQRDPDWAAQFWKSFETANAFERNGQDLYIYFDDNHQRMAFLWNPDLD